MLSKTIPRRCKLLQLYGFTSDTVGGETESTVMLEFCANSSSRKLWYWEKVDYFKCIFETFVAFKKIFSPVKCERVWEMLMERQFNSPVLSYVQKSCSCYCRLAGLPHRCWLDRKRRFVQGPFPERQVLIFWGEQVQMSAVCLCKYSMWLFLNVDNQHQNIDSPNVQILTWEALFIQLVYFLSFSAFVLGSSERCCRLPLNTRCCNDAGSASCCFEHGLKSGCSPVPDARRCASSWGPLRFFLPMLWTFTVKLSTQREREVFC